MREHDSHTFLTAQVANPFRIQNFEFLRTSNPALYSRLAGNTFFTQQTTQRNRLLRDFPHMNSLNYANMPVGVVKVHSLEAVLNRRFADGLTGVFSFSANSVRENRLVEEYDREPTIWQGSNGGRPSGSRAPPRAPSARIGPLLNEGCCTRCDRRGWQLLEYEINWRAARDCPTFSFYA